MLRDRAARVLCCFAVVAASALLASCSGWTIGANSTTATTEGKPKVAIIGDSITDLMTDNLHRQLDSQYDVTIRATDGATSKQMLDDARSLGDSWYDQLIVNLGTNDVLSDRSAAQALDAIDQILDAFPHASCVHLVTVNEHMYTKDDPNAAGTIAAINDGLRERASASDRVDVIDWSGIVLDYVAAGQPQGDITVDSVHPTDLGQRKLTSAYWDAMQHCS